MPSSPPIASQRVDARQACAGALPIADVACRESLQRRQLSFGGGAGAASACAKMCQAGPADSGLAFLQSRYRISRIELGIGLDGPGTLWLDDVKLEAVGKNVPLNGGLEPPMNLDFEQ